MASQSKIRLDQLLVEQHGYESRSRARDAILRGCVSVNGRIIRKPGQILPIGAALRIEDAADRYVSRAALKLISALKAEPIEVSQRICLDLGASTGGFCQVLLDAGAARVYAVDVGSGQLHPSLVENPNLVNIENLNVRHLSQDHLQGERPEVLTADLSFISLKLALPPALQLAADGAWGIFLIKPQFEVGKEGLGSGGIVRDETLVTRVVEDLRGWMEGQDGWRVVQILPSPITGGDGNREFLLIARKDVTDV